MEAPEGPGVGMLVLEQDPPRALSAIREAEGRLLEGKAKRELWRVRGNVRNGEHVILARDALGRVVGAAAHVGHMRHEGFLARHGAQGSRWVINMASTGEVKGTGRALLAAVAQIALANNEDLALAALDGSARDFFLAQGGREEVDARGGRSMHWEGEALRRLAGAAGVAK